jgi:3',5'-cyclic AMP phosphodiesterase CpdA
MLVAHISDLHQLSLEGVKSYHFLGKRLTGGANLLFNRAGNYPRYVAQALIEDLNARQPDHLILSGDLSNLAFTAEFKLVKTILQGLDLPPQEITVVPGNHDYYTRGSFRDDTFCRILRPYIKGDLKPGSSPFPMVRLRDQLAIVALSSAVPSLPLLAIGTLGSRQIRLVEQLLNSEACSKCFRLLVLHHSPASKKIPWKNRLTDAKAFQSMLARAGAELVVHGHLHRLIIDKLEGPDGPLPLVGVGSGTWLSPRDPQRRAQYNLYQIEDRTLVRCRVRRYDPQSKKFEPFLTAID